MKTILTFIFSLVVLMVSAQQYSGTIYTGQIASSGSDTAYIRDYTSRLPDNFAWATQIATAGESVTYQIKKSLKTSLGYDTYSGSRTVTANDIYTQSAGWFDKNLILIISNTGSSEATVEVYFNARRTIYP